jgi:hypothetical protein
MKQLPRVYLFAIHTTNTFVLYQHLGQQNSRDTGKDKGHPRAGRENPE